jgi:hypothetical protein
MSDVVSARYAAGRVEVQLDDRLLTVERRDDAGRTCSCPIELLSAALGS